MKGLSEGAADLPVEPLRRLARGLLYDRHRAEDVVQEAWLAALGAGTEVLSLGDWLAGAVRRLARNANREETRRARRERLAARPEALPDAGETSARVEVLRRLLDAVDRLDEPYRDAIVLRFFDELPPRAVARRLGVPVNTARTRVRRGLARLRAELDGDGRERTAFLAALLPFAGDPGHLARWSGVLLLQQKTLTAAALLAFAGLLWITHGLGADGRGEKGGLDVEAEDLSEAVPELPARPSTEVDADADRRSALGPEAAPAGDWVVRGHATRGGKADPERVVRGRLVEGPRSMGRVLAEARLQADVEGAFAWPLGTPAGVVTLVLEPLGEGHRHGFEQTFVPDDRAPEDVRVRTCAVNALALGLVTDRDGVPIAGARVSSVQDEAITDAEGRYRLPASSQHDSLWLRAEADGFAPGSTRLQPLAPGENVMPKLLLAPERFVSGRVVDLAGRSLADARVTSPGASRTAVRTDADGRFRLGGLPDQEWVTLQAELEGFAPGMTHGTLADELEIRLAPGVRVEGRVLAPGRVPTSFVRVALGYAPWNDPPLEAWTDADGRFSVEGVTPGATKLWVSRRGFAEDSRPITVAAGAAPLEILLEPEHVLGGLVLDGRGAPCAGALVVAEDGRNAGRMFVQATRTGTDGRFRLERLPAIDVRLGIDAHGHARLSEQVPVVDREDLVLRLEPRAGFAGRVVDAASGAPIPAFTVHARFPELGELEGAVDSLPPDWIAGVPFEDSRGHWELIGDHAPGALAAIEVRSAGYAPALVESVPARIAGEEELVIELVRGTRIAGRVVERESGAPVAGARVLRFTGRVPVEALENWSETTIEARTDASGAFLLENVPPGEMSLAVQHDDWPAHADGPFEVGSAPVERWIELLRGGRIRGLLAEVGGSALAGEELSLWRIGSAQHWKATTAADGSFKLDGLPEGRYRLGWMRTVGTTRFEDLGVLLELGPDETRTVALRPAGSATLRGVLTCAEPLPGILPARLRRLVDDSRDSGAEDPSRGFVAEHGAFQITGIAAGRHVIEATLVGVDGRMRALRSDPFVVEAGSEMRIALELRVP